MTRREQYWSAISHTIFDTDLTGVRLGLAMSSFVWFALLAWPGETFGRPTYTIMSHVMSEEAWAFIFLTDAVAQMSIVLQEDFHSKFARYFAGFNATLWGFVVISMLLSVSPPAAAISAEIVSAVWAFWIWVRPYILAEGYRRARNYSI